MSIPNSNMGGVTGMPGSLALISPEQFTNDLWAISGHQSPLESPSGSLSALDLKAPAKARREFEKGYQLLMRKDHQGAVGHLTIATAIYPRFVSAHNALGTAYLGLGQNDQARAEFSQAVSLDEHLPNSFLNLGCAELALRHFSAAQESIQKASALAPLDLTVLTALAYGQLLNRDYNAAITTAHHVHDRQHEGAAMVHFYAAAALEEQGNLAQARQELITFLKEDPKSPAAGAALHVMQELDESAKHPSAQISAATVSFSFVQNEPHSGSEQIPQNVRKLMQASNENMQIAEAEADAECVACGTTSPSAHPNPISGTAPSPKLSEAYYDGFTLHASIDEVPVFFAATDHGKSVTTLTAKDVAVVDNTRLPRPLPDSAPSPSYRCALASSSTPVPPSLTASNSSRTLPATFCRRS